MLTKFVQYWLALFNKLTVTNPLPDFDFVKNLLIYFCFSWRAIYTFMYGAYGNSYIFDFLLKKSKLHFIKKFLKKNFFLKDYENQCEISCLKKRFWYSDKTKLQDFKSQPAAISIRLMLWTRQNFICR